MAQLPVRRPRLAPSAAVAGCAVAPLTSSSVSQVRDRRLDAKHGRDDLQGFLVENHR